MDYTEHVNKNVFHFIHYDFTDHTQDEKHADNIINILQSTGANVDGCITFAEPLSPLTAKICTKLNLNGSGENGAKIAKSKFETHTVLMETNGAHRYAAKVVRINTEQDIDHAIEEVCLPAIMKFEYGSGAFCVKMVNSLDDCKNYFSEFQTKYGSKSNMKLYDAGKENVFNDLGLAFGNSFVLMEYLEGTQHNVNLILFEDELAMAFAHDNGPTRNCINFQETSESFPSSLSEDKKDGLVLAAFECCKAIGLSSGVFNVELKMTSSGPKLIEINARMPGMMSRKMILTYYGIDLVCCAFLICCGIKPVLRSKNPIKGHIMGIMCFADLHEDVLQNESSKKYIANLCNKGVLMVNRFDNQSEGSKHDAPEEDGVEIQYCNLAVIGSDLIAAKNELLKICKDLHIDSPKYKVSYFLSHFK